MLKFSSQSTKTRDLVGFPVTLSGWRPHRCLARTPSKLQVCEMGWKPPAAPCSLQETVNFHKNLGWMNALAGKAMEATFGAPPSSVKAAASIQ